MAGFWIAPTENRGGGVAAQTERERTLWGIGQATLFAFPRQLFCLLSAGRLPGHRLFRLQHVHVRSHLPPPRTGIKQKLDSRQARLSSVLHCPNINRQMMESLPYLSLTRLRPFSTPSPTPYSHTPLMKWIPNLHHSKHPKKTKDETKGPKKP